MGHSSKKLHDTEALRLKFRRFAADELDNNLSIIEKPDPSGFSIIEH
jgi:hypothetical protein